MRKTSTIKLSVRPQPGLGRISDGHYARGCGCPRCSFIDAIRDRAVELCAGGQPELHPRHASDVNVAYLLADAARVIAGT